MDVKQFVLECLYVVVSFLCGSIMFSYLIPLWTKKIDICELSSDNNPGSSNVFINCGVRLGLLCLLLDLLKGFIPVLIAKAVMNINSWLFSAVLIAPTLGHAIAPFNKFKGGKCIAVIFGETLALIPENLSFALLAVLYVFLSTVIRIRPNSKKSIIVFSIFAFISAVYSVYIGQFGVAFGLLAISGITIFKHYLSLKKENAFHASQGETTNEN